LYTLLFFCTPSSSDRTMPWRQKESLVNQALLACSSFGTKFPTDFSSRLFSPDFSSRLFPPDFFSSPEPSP
jgi:hypothetical protein